MKKIYFILVLLIVNTYQKDLHSQEPGMPDAELMIVNHANYKIKYKMYLVSQVFNGLKEYSSFAINNLDPPRSPYLNGHEDSINAQIGTTVDKSLANFDDDVHSGVDASIKFSVGYGLYKIEFYKRDSEDPYPWVLVDTCYMDWRDAGLRGVSHHFPVTFGNLDIRFCYCSEDSITFSFYSGNPQNVKISQANRHVKFWELLGTNFVDFPSPLSLPH